jgi:hypothetical protein
MYKGTLMKIYQYDKQTFEFLKETIAVENPRRTGSYMIPANHTEKQVLPVLRGYSCIFKKNGKITEMLSEDGNWEYVLDERGKTVYDKDTKESIKIDYLGELKEEHTFEQPTSEFDIWIDTWEYNIEQAKNAKYWEIKQAFEQESENSKVMSQSLNTEINADRKSLQNIEGLLAVIGSGMIPYKCYDNRFVNVDRTNLEAMRLEVIKAGQSLYNKKWDLETTIKNATTKEQIETIKW